MEPETTIKTSAGDLLLRAGGYGRVIIDGRTVPASPPVISTVGAGVVISTIQGAKIYGPPGSAFRLRGVSAVAGTVTGAATFDLYNSAGSPATVLSAPKAFGAANVPAAGVVADPTIVYAAGAYFTFRVATAADTGALADVQVQLEFDVIAA
jgi:hypothetical protein